MSTSQPAPPRWNVGDALGYGWARFRGEWSQLVLGVLVLVAGLVVAGGIGVALQAALVDVTSGIGVSLLVGALVVGLLVVAAQVLGAGVLRGALGVTEGRPFQARDVLRTDGAGPVVATGLLVAAATFVGSLLCYLPGLAVAFLTQWSLYFVLDRGLGPTQRDPCQRRTDDEPAHRVARLVRARGTGGRRRRGAVRGRSARGAARGPARRRVHLPAADRPGRRGLTAAARLLHLELDDHVPGLVVLDVDHARGADDQLVRRAAGLELDVLLGLAVDMELAGPVAGDLERHDLVPVDLQTVADAA